MPRAHNAASAFSEACAAFSGDEAAWRGVAIACVVATLLRLSELLPHPGEDGSAFRPDAGEEWIEDVTGITGMGAAMVAAELVQPRPDGLLFPRASEWLSSTAVSSAAERMRRMRERRRNNAQQCATERNGLRNGLRNVAQPVAQPLRNAPRARSSDLPCSVDSEQQVAKQDLTPNQQQSKAARASIPPSAGALQPALTISREPSPPMVTLELIRCRDLLRMLPEWDRRREVKALEALVVMQQQGRDLLALVEDLRARAGAGQYGSGWIVNALRLEAGLVVHKANTA